MKKEQKIELVGELAKELDKSQGIIVTNYKGLTYVQMDAIRREIKATGSDYRVIKNTLLSKALSANNINSINDKLVQPTACIIVNGDYASVAKIAKKYANLPVTKKFFEIKCGYFDGMGLDASGVTRIADLPSRDQLLSQALSSLNAPITNFVSLLSNIPRGFLNVLNAVKDKKGE